MRKPYQSPGRMKNPSHYNYCPGRGSNSRPPAHHSFKHGQGVGLSYTLNHSATAVVNIEGGVSRVVCVCVHAYMPEVCNGAFDCGRIYTVYTSSDSEITLECSHELYSRVVNSEIKKLPELATVTLFPLSPAHQHLR